MNDFEIEEKKRLEKRLRNAFPRKWKELTAEKQKIAVDRFYREAWLRRVSIKETLGSVISRNINFASITLGALIAILAGLVTNIIHEHLNSFGSWYEFGAPIFFFILLFLLDKFFESVINEEYRAGHFLDELLDDSSDEFNGTYK